MIGRRTCSLVVWSLVVGLVACGTDDAASRPDAASALHGELVVAAAASLTDAFGQLAADLEEAHPDLAVTLNVAASSTLAAQLLEGAPADVFASADEAHVTTVREAGLAGEPVVFATNTLVIAVEPGNPLGIGGLADLARDDVVVVLAAPTVPAGAYAAEVLDAADVELRPSSYEVDVRAALAKVAAGEADAAVVYRSDVVAAAGRVTAVGIPPEHDVEVRYPAVVLDGATNPAAAAAFVDLLTSDAGVAALEAAGFGPP